MLDVESRGTQENGGSSSGLVPLPKRVAADDEVAIGDPLRFVAELMERAAHLVATLDHDVEGLKSDQEEERRRIEGIWEARQTRAEQAIEQLAVIRGVAQRLAQRKNRPDLLEKGLARPSFQSFPFDDDTPFETLVETMEVEVRTAKGITGLIRLEGIGELLAAATRSVERMLDEANATKDELLAQTQDELTAERKEARASFEIGLQVLRRDLDQLDEALPLSARATEDQAWEDPHRANEGRSFHDEPCLLRIGNYLHPRLRNTPIPALVHLPGGAPLHIEPGHQREQALEWIRAVVLRALWSTPPGLLGITILDPTGSSDALRRLLNAIPAINGAAPTRIASTAEEVDAALHELVARNDAIDLEVLSSRHASLAEANADAGHVVRPWHLLIVLDHPTGLSDDATIVLRNLANGAARFGLGVIVQSGTVAPVAFGPDGRPRRRTPLPPMTTIKSVDGEMVIDLERAGRWSVALAAPPSDSETIELAGRLAPAARPEPVAASGLAKILGPLWGSPGLPTLTGPVDGDDPATWWRADATVGIGLPLGRTADRQTARLVLDDDQLGSAILTGTSPQDVENGVTALIDGLTVLYPPDEAQLVCVSLRGRSVFDGCIDSRLTHARLLAVDAEVEFTVAVLEGLALELGRRRTAVTGGGRTKAPRLVAIVQGFTELLETRDRHGVRAAELLDSLLTRAHRAGIHLVLADVAAAVSDELVQDHPELRRCRTRLHVDGGQATLTAPDRELRFPLVDIGPGEHERLLWEVRGRAQQQDAVGTPQIYDGHTPARLDRSGVERLASWSDRRAQRMKPRFWLGDPTTLGGPVELLLRRADGANLLVVTEDEFAGRGMVLGALTTLVLNHGESLHLVVVDFLPAETGFAEAAAILETGGTLEVARRRHLDKAIDRVKRMVSDRHAANAFTEPPVVLVIAGIGRARDLEVDAADVESVERHHALETILREGPEVGVHTLVWCEAPATLGRRLDRNELREFSYRAVGPLDPDVSRGITGSEAAASLGSHQALLYDDDTGSAIRFRPYRPPSPEWLRALITRSASDDA